MTVTDAPYLARTSRVSSLDPSFTTMIWSSRRVCLNSESRHSQTIALRLKVGTIALTVVMGASRPPTLDAASPHGFVAMTTQSPRINESFTDRAPSHSNSPNANPVRPGAQNLCHGNDMIKSAEMDHAARPIGAQSQGDVRSEVDG